MNEELDSIIPLFSPVFSVAYWWSSCHVTVCEYIQCSKSSKYRASIELNYNKITNTTVSTRIYITRS